MLLLSNTRFKWDFFFHKKKQKQRRFYLRKSPPLGFLVSGLFSPLVTSNVVVFLWFSGVVSLLSHTEHTSSSVCPLSCLQHQAGCPLCHWFPRNFCSMNSSLFTPNIELYAFTFELAKVSRVCEGLHTWKVYSYAPSVCVALLFYRCLLPTIQRVIALGLQATASLLLVPWSLAVIPLLVGWRGPHTGPAVVHSVFEHLIKWQLISLGYVRRSPSHCSKVKTMGLYLLFNPRDSFSGFLFFTNTPFNVPRVVRRRHKLTKSSCYRWDAHTAGDVGSYATWKFNGDNEKDAHFAPFGSLATYGWWLSSLPPFCLPQSGCTSETAVPLQP